MPSPARAGAVRTLCPGARHRTAAIAAREADHSKKLAAGLRVTTRGLCSDVFRAVLSDHDLVTCRKILHEIQRILRSKFSVPAELIAEYVELLSHDAIMAEPGDMAVVQIKDRDDVEIIAAAITGAVDVLVTGDAELQALTSIQGVRVLSPRAFWEELKAQHGDVPDGR